MLFCNRKFILLFLSYHCLVFSELNQIEALTELTNRIVVTTRPTDTKDVSKYMERQYNFKYKETIVPSLNIYEYVGLDDNFKNISYLKEIKDVSNGKILDIESVTWSVNVLRMQSDNSKKMKTKPKDCSRNSKYGMNIQEAWGSGFNGEGIVVAVTDVGVDVEIQDLAPNINNRLKYNFIYDNTDVTPETFDSYPESLAYTDHGNRCSGLIVAVKDNRICGTGIAYKAQLAALKIFEVRELQWISPYSFSFSSDAIQKALAYELQDVYIFSNSWVQNEPFEDIKEATKKILKYGAEKGRDSKGSIYVFPAGPIAEGFSNSIYTITVSSVDPYGGVPVYVELSAAVLTSTYGNGLDKAMMCMLTTSHNPVNCTKDFQGTSASTAMVSGMIALALQANNNLRWRDIQHLLVRASHSTGLEEENNFQKNGAGHKFHESLGFGLMNTNKLVTLAKEWKNVKNSKRSRQTTKRSERKLISEKSELNYEEEISTARLKVDCNSTKTCVEKVEHVRIEIDFLSPNESNLEIAIKSPMGTKSLLVKRLQSTTKVGVERRNAYFLSVQFWDENPDGIWTLILKQTNINEGYEAFGIESFTLEIYGTHKKPKTDKENAKPVKPTKESEYNPQTTEYWSATHAVMAVVVPLVIVIISIRYWYTWH